MFELINQLRSELSGTALLPVPTDLKAREEVLKDVVNRLYRSAVANTQAEVSVAFGTSLHYSSFEAIKSGIKFSPLYLLTSDEIPQEFRFVGDVHDFIDRDNTGTETTDDLAWFESSTRRESFSKWICEKLNIPVQNISRKTIKANLHFLSNPQKAKDAIKFVLMHELGHYHHNDPLLVGIINISNYVLSFGWPLCVVFVVGMPLFGSLFFIGTAAGVSVIALGILGNLSFKFAEERADAFAITHSPSSIDGGIYLFQTSKNENIQFREELIRNEDAIRKQSCIDNFLLWFYKTTISPEGDNILDLSHPSLSSRIATFEAAKQRHRGHPSLTEVTATA